MDENLVNVTDEGVDINVGGVSNFTRFTDKSLGDNFQYLKNPTTNKKLGVGNDFFNQYKQDLADQGFNPVSGADAFKPDVVDNESDNIVSGTQGDRDDVTLTSQDADNAIGDAESGTESPNSVLERLNAERERINTTTQTELDSIEQAGEDAGAAYQSIVDEQEENRKQTMASEVVRAGEKGGFLSTQQAGTAALLATDGKKGEAFVGTGGALDRTRQTLDRAVAMAKAKQQEAIANAKAARSTAISTGKKEDYQMAVDLAKLAQEFQNDADDLKIKKRQLELSESAEDRAWNADTRANSAEDRADDKFTYDMWKDEIVFKDGQKRFDRTQSVQESWLNRSITNDMRIQGQEDIIKLANSGMSLEDISEEERTKLETLSGFDSGSFEAIYSRAYNQARLGDVMDMAKLEKAQNDVKKSLANSGGSGSGGGGNSRSGAGNYFSDTQIAKGAATAGMTIEEFKGLSQDEANTYIYGDGDSGSGGGNLTEEALSSLAQEYIERKGAAKGEPSKEEWDVFVNRVITNFPGVSKERADQMMMNALIKEEGGVAADITEKEEQKVIEDDAMEVLYGNNYEEFEGVSYLDELAATTIGIPSVIWELSKRPYKWLENKTKIKK